MIYPFTQTVLAVSQQLHLCAGDSQVPCALLLDAWQLEALWHGHAAAITLSFCTSFCCLSYSSRSRSQSSSPDTVFARHSADSFARLLQICSAPKGCAKGTCVLSGSRLAALQGWRSFQESDLKTPTPTIPNSMSLSTCEGLHDINDP